MREVKSVTCVCGSELASGGEVREGKAKREWGGGH